MADHWAEMFYLPFNKIQDRLKPTRPTSVEKVYRLKTKLDLEIRLDLNTTNYVRNFTKKRGINYSYLPIVVCFSNSLFPRLKEFDKDNYMEHNNKKILCD